MTEFPGYLPWYVGGDPWFTDDEIEALIDAANKRSEQRRKASRDAEGARRGRRGRR